MSLVALKCNRMRPKARKLIRDPSNNSGKKQFRFGMEGKELSLEMFARWLERWLRALATLPEVQSSVPNNLMVTHRHLQWDLVSSSGMQAYMGQNVAYIINKYLKKEYLSIFSGLGMVGEEGKRIQKCLHFLLGYKWGQTVPYWDLQYRGYESKFNQFT